MQVSQSEDVGAMVDVEMEKHEQQANFTDIAAVLGNSRHQILAAQFECYLKIISEPPRTEEGDEIVPFYLLIADNSRNILLDFFSFPYFPVASSLLL